MVTNNPQAINNPTAVMVVRLMFMLMGAIPLLLGLGIFAGAGYFGNRHYTILKKWPTVDAEVVRSELAHRRDKDANGRTSTTVYQAHVDFRYTVGGKQYTTPSSSYYSTSNRAEMQQEVDTYAPGTHHPIRYNPAKPNDISFDASFTIGFFGVELLSAGGGLVCTAIGAALFYIGWAMGRAKIHCPSCGAMVRETKQSCPTCGAAL
jgi:hypothetical protein